VPEAPATKPAVASVAGFTGITTARIVIAIATSTITASATPICASVNRVTSHTPTAVPGMRAGSAHAIADQSTCNRSPATINPVASSASHSGSTGTSDGAASAITGALTRLTPRPITVWTNAPSATTTPISRTTSIGTPATGQPRSGPP